MPSPNHAQTYPEVPSAPEEPAETAPLSPEQTELCNRLSTELFMTFFFAQGDVKTQQEYLLPLFALKEATGSLTEENFGALAPVLTARLATGLEKFIASRYHLKVALPKSPKGLTERARAEEEADRVIGYLGDAVSISTHNFDREIARSDNRLQALGKRIVLRDVQMLGRGPRSRPEGSEDKGYNVRTSPYASFSYHYTFIEPFAPDEPESSGMQTVVQESLKRFAEQNLNIMKFSDSRDQLDTLVFTAALPAVIWGMHLKEHPEMKDLCKPELKPMLEEFLSLYDKLIPENINPYLVIKPMDKALDQYLFNPASGNLESLDKSIGEFVQEARKPVKRLRRSLF